MSNYYILFVSDFGKFVVTFNGVVLGRQTSKVFTLHY